MTRFEPVMYEDASEHRKTSAARYSSLRAMRPIGINCVSFSTKSPGWPAYTPPGQSAFISSAGVPSPHFCDQVGLFNDFRYKNMPPS